MEMLQDRSECRAVSRNKDCEAAASALYCCLLIPSEAGMECAANLKGSFNFPEASPLTDKSNRPG